MASLVVTLEVFDVEGAARAGKPFELKYAVAETTVEQWVAASKLLERAQKIFEKNQPKEGDE